MSVPTRLARLRAAMAEAEIPALLVSQPESRRYLSGYTAPDIPARESAGCLLITEDAQFLLTDPRTEAQAAVEAQGFEVCKYGGTVRMTDVLRDTVVAVGERVVGFDAEHVTYNLWQRLSEALEGVASLKPAPALVDGLRMVKDDDEIRALRASIALNDAAFAHLARTVRPGSTEMELAWEMENFVRTHGGEDISFPPITVGGPNSAIPHAMPSPRAVQADELVLFDIGSKLGGYCSDMTRTVCLESVSPRLEKAWHVVLDALLEAEARVRPGMTGAEVDSVAREVIAHAGFGEHFSHGLGHGIGLEIHEPPWLTQSRGTDVLQPGMVFSIEPGVYLPGDGGVRLEDLVLLTERGAEVLCNSPKKLYLSEVLGDLNR